MKKVLSIGFIVMFVGFLFGNTRVVRPVKVATFHSILVEGNLNVVFVDEVVNSVRIEASEKVADLITIEVKNGVLVISGSVYDVQGKATVFVSNKTIGSIVLNGTGSISGPIDADNLKVELEGVGNITLTGIISNLEIGLNGSGNLNFAKIEAKTTSIDLNGTGNVEISVTEKLNVTINGTGNVTFYGSPKVNKAINGTGSVTKG